jgi:hypothetical protein
VYALTSFGGDIRVTDFEGAQVWSDGVWLWGGCRGGLWLVGRLIVEQPVAVEPQTWGRMKALYR